MQSSPPQPLAYTGARAPLFGLALRTGLLTMLTLGIYRFWAKTRIRKYVWSSVRIGGDGLEYTGIGLEKFLGFLVAVVVLAVYLGLVQLALFWFGLHYIVDPQTDAEALKQVAVIYISLIAVAPLLLFARYRARRYMLARTRLRGIRFGMEHGAWGYVWRAMGHWVLTILSLGILLPRQTFHLERYMTNRSFFGDARFDQGGQWTGLYPAMKHILFALLFLAGGGLLAALDPGAVGLAVVLGICGFFWGMFGLVYYRVRSFAYLTGQKTLGAVTGFTSVPSTGTVIGIYIGGALIASLVGAAMIGVATGITTAMFGSMVGPGAPPGPVGFAVIAALFLGGLALIGALSVAFITQPTIAHFVGTTGILNPAALDTIRQRAADSGADAEGFADALDVGAGI